MTALFRHVKIFIQVNEIPMMFAI